MVRQLEWFFAHQQSDVSPVADRPPFGWGWSRYPRYRLMKLTRTGRRNELAHGSLIYLLRLARQARITGRSWIELNMEPATAETASALSRTA
jgi:hypothetical protein